MSKAMFDQRMPYMDSAADSRKAINGTGTPAGSLNLIGEVAGEWDTVDGYITYAQDFTATEPQVGVLQIVLRGFETERDANSNIYRADWDRRIYWINFDGDGPGIPHLLGALEITPTYVPTLGDAFPEFNNDPAVIAECTPVGPCALNWVPYLLYRDQITDYSGYPDGAAEADLLFVANADGDAIAVSLDLYDAALAPNGRTVLNEGDELQLSTVGYKLSEPGFLYVVTPMEFVTLDADVLIERANYIPGEDFIDPFVTFNAGTRKLRFLLDAWTDTANTLAGPYDLGLTWGDALDFLFRGNMESLVPDGTSQAPAAGQPD